MGRRQRIRPVAEVMDEIIASDNRQLFFVDDALALNRPVASELFGAMQPLGLKWAGQGGVSLAEDVPLLRLMKRSGCVGLLLGFESVESERGGDLNKLKHLSIDFMEAMRRFHGEGIAVMGAFIFGFDHETVDVFDSTLEFVNRSRLDIAELRILTPFPGTPLYARLREEGRLFAPDWWLLGYPPDTLLFRRGDDTRPTGGRLRPPQPPGLFSRLHFAPLSGNGATPPRSVRQRRVCGPERRHPRAVPKRIAIPQPFVVPFGDTLPWRDRTAWERFDSRAGDCCAARSGECLVHAVLSRRGRRAPLVCGPRAAAGDTLDGVTAAFSIDIRYYASHP